MPPRRDAEDFTKGKIYDEIYSPLPFGSPRNFGNTNAPAKGQGKRQLMTWHPREIEPPVVQPALHRMGAVERSAEVIRYAVFTTEYWVSPRGGLREWLRLNLWFALVLAVPALLITPIASYMLAELAAGSGQLANIAKNLSQIPAAIRNGALAVAGMGAIMAFKFLFR